MLAFIKNLFGKSVEYELFTGNQRELEREKMYELQNKSSNEIWIVAGELDHKFYNDTFVNIIAKKLKTIPCFTVNILFSKDERLVHEEKIKKILKENEPLCTLLKAEAFEGRFAMYLSEKRHPNHFGIVDNSILIEKIHEPRGPRDVLLVYNYKKLIEKYKRYFFKLINEPGVKKLSHNDFQTIAV